MKNGNLVDALDGGNFARHGKEYESAREGVAVIKKALQSAPANRAPLQAPSGLGMELLALFETLMLDSYFRSETIIVCMTDKNGRPVMGIARRSDISFWLDPRLATGYGMREIPRIYSFEEYAGDFIRRLRLELGEPN